MTTIENPSYTTSRQAWCEVEMRAESVFTVIVVRGQMILATSMAWTAAMEMIQPEKGLLLDLSPVSSIDASALQMLVEMKQAANVTVIAASRTVRRFVELAGLGELLGMPVPTSRRRKGSWVRRQLVYPPPFAGSRNDRWQIGVAVNVGATDGDLQGGRHGHTRSILGRPDLPVVLDDVAVDPSHRRREGSRDHLGTDQPAGEE